MSKWLSKLNGNPTQWLLDSNPWTRHRTLSDLLEYASDSGEVRRAKEELVNDRRVRKLVEEAAEWFPLSITRHNVPGIPYYKMKALAEFGLDIGDPGIPAIVRNVRKHVRDGLYAVRTVLPEKGVKVDLTQDKWYALPCDTPLLSYSLYKFMPEDGDVKESIKIIARNWDRPEGWFCNFHFVLGQYNKLRVACPMSALMALESFSLLPELHRSSSVKHAFSPMKYHYESKKSLYWFGRSKKFWTFKFPYVWSNALYEADVLSRFPGFRNEPLVKDLIAWIEKSQNPDGRFFATSVYQSYKDWDFGGKKQPSPWITFLCCRILKRYYQ